MMTGWISCAYGLRVKISVFGDDYPTYDGTCVRDYIHVIGLSGPSLAIPSQRCSSPGEQVTRPNWLYPPRKPSPFLAGNLNNTGELCFGISLWIFRNARWGVPQPPGPPAHALGRTRLTAWLFRSRWSLFPAHPRRNLWARPRTSRAGDGAIFHALAVTSTSITSMS